ncbi:hypothetical protein A3B93_00260 [Candidatus Nomurabacteria bacterium RIFCSPHIGHO2_02_FULL_42_24]|uniref:Uncharacterized protein n=1 Tax=Candidatus Nomurabacteria bacterium RIFCSPHIGHO2_02_FULL_42_24 TaxID=1801757 RepID=A0A1F6WLV9_9BACT|nr:MAG: hypothetical protein A3B93_00260 [Candidatus Nomurabacteria bacterium RIFCSPHIGHO2_02_FULL_42_24]
MPSFIGLFYHIFPTGGIHCTKFELILKAILMIRNTSVSRALRASVRSTELSKNGKCGETLNANADSVLRNNFAGGRIRKTETPSF